MPDCLSAPPPFLPRSQSTSPFSVELGSDPSIGFGIATILDQSGGTLHGYE